ncbi:MAG: 3-deoxy-D-manno-octulosonate 8-phosphate phosphatase, YrbI family [Parcubacteria group bacterium GW2011_GWB1_44_7]|nr:MAG: 3-deoxy-D-manno-octulosonate 8-phosphate phosphatase, YrbI family [Parcubacteria group bacterium GW2011_GWB1_44_7]
MNTEITFELERKIKNLKLIATDFDGVWTDGKVIFCQDGTESVICSRKDTLRVKDIKATGIKLFVISKESNPVVMARCQKMSIDCWQGVDDKLSLLKKLLEKEGVTSYEAAFVGDDINDLECLRFVDLPLTVADGHDACKKVALYVTLRKGGDHAMREIFDLILSLR